jgi:hypothetical protein
VLAVNPKADTASVAVYFINGEYFTKYMEKFNQKLSSIRYDQIEVIGYSRVKACGYQPGRGTIYIRTCHGSNREKKR